MNKSKPFDLSLSPWHDLAILWAAKMRKNEPTWEVSCCLRKTWRLLAVDAPARYIKVKVGQLGEQRTFEVMEACELLGTAFWVARYAFPMSSGPNRVARSYDGVIRIIREEARGKPKKPRGPRGSNR